MNHTWGIIIGQQANVGNANPGDANIACPNQGCTEEVTLLSSYIPPVVSSVTAVTTTGLMDTAGGDEILIIGTNFGPNSALPLNMINVTYSNPYLSDLQQPGVELEGVVYRPVGCEVINHELATCRSVAGIGSQFLWTIWIGGQVWPSRNGYWYDSSLLLKMCCVASTGRLSMFGCALLMCSWRVQTRRLEQTGGACVCFAKRKCEVSISRPETPAGVNRSFSVMTCVEAEI